VVAIREAYSYANGVWFQVYLSNLDDWWEVGELVLVYVTVQSKVACDRKDFWFEAAS